MKTEKQIIEYEANLIDCMDRWFEARHLLERTKDRERMFADFQVIQVFVMDKWVPIYQRLKTDHYTIPHSLMYVVDQFMNEVINSD